MSKPLLIDLFCGLGGWTRAFLDEGWDAIGFDIEQHDYGTGGYPGQLVLQDICTLEGCQIAHADCIVASSPCQEFSYRAMPWKRAKALGPPILGIKLFWQAFRLQREASDAKTQERGCRRCGIYHPAFPILWPSTSREFTIPEVAKLQFATKTTKFSLSVVVELE